MLSTRNASRRLFSLAVEQGGYFTAKQAQQVGYDYPHLNYHVSRGNFVRVGHGVYRLAGYPPTEYDDLIHWTLWSRDRSDRPQAVVSHESALVLHELSELLPVKTHLTVPPGFRKNPPEGIVLHIERLDRSDIEERQGFYVTTALRTLLDVARSDISQEQLNKAITEALARGLVRRRALLTAARSDPSLSRLQIVLNSLESRYS